MCVHCAAHADEAALVAQLGEQILHLESRLQVANAQLAVGDLEKRSLQTAFEESTRQLSSSETNSALFAARLAAQQADLQVCRHKTPPACTSCLFQAAQADLHCNARPCRFVRASQYCPKLAVANVGEH